jgi:transmembrane sensor
MLVNKERLQYLLSAYTEGNISYEEYIELAALIHQPEAEELIYEGMDNTLNALRETFSHNLPNDVLYQKIISDKRFKPVQPQTLQIQKSPVLRLPWLRIAASIIAIVAVSALYFYLKPKPADKVIAENQTLIKFSTPAGTRRQLQLPDSSVVWLNAGSTIQYPAAFSSDTREVFLEGEAFFDVAHNDAKKFIVRTGAISTQVLGTAFNINAYSPQTLTVTVLRGRVSVADSAAELAVLTPNKQLKLEGEKTSVLDVNAADIVAWKNGELLLNNVNMAEAAEIIARWFNVSFVFENTTLQKCSVSVSFLEGENINEVMDVISGLNNFQYRVENNKVIISGKGCE